MTLNTISDILTIVMIQNLVIGGFLFLVIRKEMKFLRDKINKF